MLEMSSDQFMAPTITDVRYSVKRSAVNGRDYPARMTNRDRTEFAARVIAAREHAGLTQTELGEAAGIKQSTIAEMEVSGKSSLKTPQIARACGVDAYWLATGEGPMVAEGTEGDPAQELEVALSVLVAALQAADADKLIAVERWLSAMASDPATAKNKSDLILQLLVTNADNSDKPPHDELRRSHIFKRTARLTLGDKHGRRDSDAATGGSKK